MVRWQQLWNETNQKHKVLEAVVELTNRVPERNLECFVYGAGLNAMSTPFLMPTRNRKGNKLTDEYFIQTVTHEMLHIFLTTNTKEYWEMVRTKYTDEEAVCQNHIILYAMLFKVYKKCFDTEPPDFARDNLPAGYARAIAIVKEVGSEALIQEYTELVTASH
jgi:hypothetical protein